MNCSIIHLSLWSGFGAKLNQLHSQSIFQETSTVPQNYSFRKNFSCFWMPELYGSISKPCRVIAVQAATVKGDWAEADFSVVSQDSFRESRPRL